MLEGNNFGCDPANEFGSMRIDAVDSRNPASDWYESNFNRFIERCGELLAVEIGRKKITAVLLGGSFALGEGAIDLSCGKVSFLSDVDLLVILDSAEDLVPLLVRRGELGMKCESLLPDVSFEGNVDVGIVSMGELGSFPKSPGTWNLKYRGKTVYGDDKVLGMLPSFDEGDIGPAEGVTLLENRMASLLGSFPEKDITGEKESSAFFYQIAKVYTDVITAALCADGRYVPTYLERWQAVYGVIKEWERGDLLGGASVNDLEGATMYKICPVPEMRWDFSPDSQKVFAKAAGVAIAAWRSVASLIDPAIAGSIAAEDPGVLAGMRRGGMSRLDLLRSWKNFLGECPVSVRGVIALSMRDNLLRAGPFDILRSAAVGLTAMLTDAGPDALVTGYRGGFPFEGPSWVDAARSCSLNWKRFVSGRRE